MTLPPFSSSTGFRQSGAPLQVALPAEEKAEFERLMGIYLTGSSMRLRFIGSFGESFYGAIPIEDPSWEFDVGAGGETGVFFGLTRLFNDSTDLRWRYAFLGSQQGSARRCVGFEFPALGDAVAHEIPAQNQLGRELRAQMVNGDVGFFGDTSNTAGTGYRLRQATGRNEPTRTIGGVTFRRFIGSNVLKHGNDQYFLTPNNYFSVLESRGYPLIETTQAWTDTLQKYLNPPADDEPEEPPVDDPKRLPIISVAEEPFNWDDPIAPILNPRFWG